MTDRERAHASKLLFSTGARRRRGVRSTARVAAASLLLLVASSPSSSSSLYRIVAANGASGIRGGVDDGYDPPPSSPSSPSPPSRNRDDRRRRRRLKGVDGSDNDDGCDGKSHRDCVADRECKFDESADECVELETSWTQGGVDDGDDDGDDGCGGKRFERCVEDPRCRYDGPSQTCAELQHEGGHGTPPANEEEEEGGGVDDDHDDDDYCAEKSKKRCFKSSDRCKYDVLANACRSLPSPPTASPTNIPTDFIDPIEHCGGRMYHPASVVEIRCSNDDVYPSSWDEDRERYFFAKAEDCCKAFYAGYENCEMTNVCSPPSSSLDDETIGGGGENEGNDSSSPWDAYCRGKHEARCVRAADRCDYDRSSGTCLGARVHAKPASGPGPLADAADPTNPPRPTTPPPTTGMPTTAPLPTYPPTTTTRPTRSPATLRPTVLADDGSVVDPSCYDDRPWHLSRSPKRAKDYGSCTNDRSNVPEAWYHPSMERHFLFRTVEECCLGNFGEEVCDSTDVCREGTDPPVSSPPTSWPTFEPWPTYGPSATPPEKSGEASCGAKWHISTKNDAAAEENTCTNDADFPKSWSSPSKRDHFLYDTAAACCEGVFPDAQSCELVNVCPASGGGVVGASSGDVASDYAYARTAAPTEVLETERPTRRPTGRPTRDDPWFVDRTSGKCVQSCEGSSPCGGLLPQWEDSHSTAYACCASMPWKAFEDCVATPSPTPRPEPTARPSRRPSRSPSKRPTGRPTESPTTHPTIDCSVFPWHMSIDEGDTETCTNSGEFPASWLENPEMFLHPSSEVCCQTFFGKADCKAKNACAALNRANAEEANGANQDEGGGEDQGGGPSADCSVYRWHISTVAGEDRTCTNSDDFPAAWLDHAEHFLHPTSEVCCQRVFGGQANCQTKDRCAENTATGGDDKTGSGPPPPADDTFVPFDGGGDDFEGSAPGRDALPWSFGDPPEWVVDDTVSSNGSRSIVNVPSNVEGDSQTLTLRLDLPSPATISCMARMDVAMPFDRFVLSANGMVRNVYYRPLDGWTPVRVGVEGGENTIEFAVTNGDIFPDFDRREDADRYGTGRVWLDQCEVRLTGSA